VHSRINLSQEMRDPTQKKNGTSGKPMRDLVETKLEHSSLLDINVTRRSDGTSGTDHNPDCSKKDPECGAETVVPQIVRLRSGQHGPRRAKHGSKTLACVDANEFSAGGHWPCMV
jgi:hypothetical protein